MNRKVIYAKTNTVKQLLVPLLKPYAYLQPYEPALSAVFKFVHVKHYVFSFRKAIIVGDYDIKCK